MPLSIHKLQNLLATKGFVPTKYYILDGSCFYIEIFSIKTAEIFLLYIPSKYNFPPPEDGDRYKMKYIDMESEDKSVVDNYGDGVNQSEMYADANIALSPDKDKLEEDLENNYKRPISLTDISNQDTAELKANYRQLKRLRYCVQNIKYKLAIIVKNYIVAIRRDDSINCFVLKNYPRTESKKLYIVVDLETYYSKPERLSDDIQTVRKSIYSVLERNQSTHCSVINKILEGKKTIAIIPKKTETKRTQYNILLTQAEEMLSVMVKAGDKIIEKIHQLNSTNTGGLSDDINKAHERARLDKELDRINTLREEVVKVILDLREKRENAALSVDKILFDGSVMLNGALENFGRLGNFCRN